MSFKKICEANGGIWEDSVGCKVDDKLFYESNQDICETNGDRWTKFVDELDACLELSVNEFCDERLPATIPLGAVPEMCASNVVFPRKKLLQAMDNNHEVWLKNIYKHQDLTDALVREAIERKTNSLDVLYANQIVSTDNKKRIIDKRLQLDELYRFKNLDESLVDMALEAEFKEFKHQLQLKRKKSDIEDIGVNLHSLFSNQNLSEEQITKAIAFSIDLIDFYKKEDISVESRDVLEKEADFLDALYKHQTLDEYHVDTALMHGKALSGLYQGQKLSKRQVDKALKIGDDTFYLYKNQKLTEKQIDKAIDSGLVAGLYETHKLTTGQIDKALDLGLHLTKLFENNKLLSRQIDHVIETEILETAEINTFLVKSLFSTQELSELQVLKVLSMQRDRKKLLNIFFKNANLLPNQVKYLLRQYDLILENPNLPQENISEVIEYGSSKALARLYENSQMSQDNISKAIDKNIALSTLYKNQSLSDDNIKKAIDNKNSVNCLYESKNTLSSDLIDYAIDKGTFLDSLVESQILNDTQIKKIITLPEIPEKRKHVLATLFKASRDTRHNFYHLSKEHIDLVLDAVVDNKIESEALGNLFKYHNLTDEQIEKAIDRGISVGYLYNPKKDEYGYSQSLSCVERELSPKLVSKAIDKGKHLNDLASNQKLNKRHVLSILEWIKNNKSEDEDERSLYDIRVERTISALYERSDVRFTNNHINYIIENNLDISNFVVTAKPQLNDKQINKIMMKGVALDVIYSHVKLSDECISKAIKKGKELDKLFDNQKISEKHINQLLDYVDPNHLDSNDSQKAFGVIENIFLLSYKDNELYPSNIERLVEYGFGLDKLYKKFKLNDKAVAKAIERGEHLHELYQNQKVSRENISKAIERGESLAELVNPRHPTKWIYNEHVKLILDKLRKGEDIPKIVLDNICQNTPHLKSEYRSELMKHLNYTQEDMDKIKGTGIFEYCTPDNFDRVKGAVEDAVRTRIDDAPLKELVGTYDLKVDPWQPIKDWVEENGYYFKGKNLKHVYHMVDGDERKRKLGSILIDKEPDLYKKWQVLMSQKAKSEPDDSVEIVISDEPLDIVAKSTGQPWESCEKIGWSYGDPGLDGCGFCSDIRANNLIAYIKRKDEKGEYNWLGRCVLRWCNREDDKKPDVFIEKYYRHPYDGEKYRKPFLSNLKNIIRKKGFSANYGRVICNTPYKFEGYVDGGNKGHREFITNNKTSRGTDYDGKIYYLVGDRPEKKGGKK